MKTNELVSKYIDSAEQVFRSMTILTQNTSHVAEDKVVEVVNHAKHYLCDAKYYRDKTQFEIGLASVAYCEGLLDALRLLGLVDFSWPTKHEQ